MSAPQSAAQALRQGVAALQDAGIAGAAGDARALLAHALGMAPDRLILALQSQISPKAMAQFTALITARISHQPIAQIIGQRLFWGRRFQVTRDTLDPRPETEELVAEALRHPFASVLDLGTGTGCILLSLLADRTDARGIGCDLSAAALDVARRNAQTWGLSQRADFVQSDWFSAISGRFDLIVANPPYIAVQEMATLSPDVRDWEPHLALTDGGDGLGAYRAIAAGLGPRLVAGGRVLLEIGPSQGASVAALLTAQGLSDLRILPDMDGRDRVVCAVKSAIGGATAA